MGVYDGFVDLELCDGVREGEDFFEVEIRFAELQVSEPFDIFQEIDLILELYSHYFILQGFDDSKGDKHRRQVFFRDDEIPDSFCEFYWEVVEEEGDEPLEDQELVNDAYLLQFLIDLR